MGITGAALAWALRVILDAVFLFVFSHRFLPENRIVFPRLPLMVAAALAIFGALTMPMGLSSRIVLVFFLTTIGVVASWFWLMSDRERTAFQMRLRRRNAHS